MQDNNLFMIHSFARGLLDQLTTEASQEKCDTRRLMLLKSQVYMLERQCYSMSLQINQRNESIEQAYNTLENIVAEMDGWPGSETSDNIVIKRSDYENVVKTVRGVGMRFNKISETSEVGILLSFQIIVLMLNAQIFTFNLFL